MDYKALVNTLLKKGDVNALEEAYIVCKEYEFDKHTVIYDKNHNETVVFDEDSFAESHKLMRKVCSESRGFLMSKGASLAAEILKKSLLFEAPYSFDEFMQYVEFEREASSKFYMPRRPQLLPLVNALQKLEDGDLTLLGISLPPRIGKALANDTPILTRYGWKNHGDLKVGDEVIGLDGKFKKVTHVHPKCMLDVEIRFTNGERIVCHENHEWMISDRNKNIGKYFVTETKDIETRKLEVGNPGHRGHRYMINLAKRDTVLGEHKNLPLHPYVLGVWLGDGANRNPRICNPKSDHAIIDKIVSLGYPVRWQTEHNTTHVMYCEFDIRKELRSFDMCHSKRTTDKYIPDEYLTASIEQRLQLLAGLLDTDGTLAKNRYTFTTTDEKLKNSFIALVSTFGWRVCVREIEPCTSSSGIVGRKKCYVMGFDADIEIPCALKRKQNYPSHHPLSVCIKSIKRISPVEGNCITVEGDGMYLAGKTMIPTHNTTLAEFFMAWTSGRHPELSCLIGSHDNAILKGMHGEIYRIFVDAEYLWQDVFPNVPFQKRDIENLRLNLGKEKRFETLMFASIKGGAAGKYTATNILYCDDLVESLEQAMSPVRMENLWNAYSVDLRQRKQGNSKELHISTRWSLNDIIGRIERKWGESDKSMFINIPALDDEGNSNFDYPYNLGFTTQMYNDLRDGMDDASWRALYMGEPVERKGQLYPPDELRRYFTLPEREPDAVISVCDTKDTGEDYAVMPIAYVYGDDYYIEDCICDNGRPDVIDVRLADKLCQHKVKMARFESNRGGSRCAETVEKYIKEKHGITHITTKWNQANKETRIIMSQPWVKKHCIFRDESVYKHDREYRTMMNMLCSYTMMGKNDHDDVPDAFSDLSDFVVSFASNVVQVGNRRF